MTKITERYSALILSTALVLLGTSCETSDKKANTTPVAQAQAPTITPQPQIAPPPAPVAVVPQAPKPPDPVEKMIADAEKQYQEGQQDYSAGHLEAAKASFDQAVNVLLEGPVDARSDERLQNELDKISEGVNQLEVAALQQGDGFTEQKAQPAPIDEANEVTFPVDPNVKARAEAQVKETRSDLPLIMNDYVASYINFYSTRAHGTVERALVRSGRYRDMITRVLKEEGVPQDLIYLAEAESGFEPLALSRAGARGMWQFMSSRASGYGLQRSWWIDERQDPEKATRAAAHHLKDLYSQFGDWYLAMAAYNSGPGNVQQAVRRTGYADFWELYKRNVLPKETKNYVPIILAFTIMAKNPAQYGLDAVQPDPAMKYDVVKVDYPVDLRLVAECVDAPLDMLIDLNPSLLRRTTPKDQPFELHLPEGTKEKYQTAIASIPVEKRVVWRYYTVQQGDTLAGVARKYHTTERAIVQANNLDGSEIAADAKLVIPVSGAGANGKIVYSRYASHYKTHTGDTVLTVAEDFVVPPDRLRRWNRLKGNDLRRGRVLVVYKPLGPGEADKAPKRRKRTHKTAVNGGPTTDQRSNLNASSR